MNRILQILSHLTGVNYMLSDWQNLVAEVKASSLDEDVKSEILGVAQKAMDAETKRNIAVAALLEKYNKTDNIEPQSPEDDDEGFF